MEQGWLWPRPLAAKASLRTGKTALMWHVLQGESAASGQSISCVRCDRVHVVVPRFGGCVCGSYGFEVLPAKERSA